MSFASAACFDPGYGGRLRAHAGGDFLLGEACALAGLDRFIEQGEFVFQTLLKPRPRPSHGLLVCRAPEGTGVHRIPSALQNPEDLLAPFADPCALIAFFHDREADYERKDRILHDLVSRYRQGGRYEALDSFFLVLFAPRLRSSTPEDGGSMPRSATRT